VNVGRPGWLRRARPLLGTLVEVGLAPASEACADAALHAAFAALADVQAALSRFEPHSELSRFHALPCGAGMAVGDDMAVVLGAAQALRAASDGVFDVSLGTAPDGWRLDGRCLHKLDPRTRLDLGGIGKGHAVDRAIDALIAEGCSAGWVNAGGDLRVFGDVDLPLALRDEHRGGARRVGSLRDGAFATSRFGAGARSRASAPQPVHAHASVAAPLCLWADALTKVVAVSGDTAHPLLFRHAAQAWLH
jgi:thiamine biosynthesis lipoprotein